MFDFKKLIIIVSFIALFVLVSPEVLAANFDFSSEKVVEVIRSNSLTSRVKTKAKTVGEFLQEAQIDLHEGDLVYPGPETEIKGGLRIIINQPLTVRIKVDGQTLTKRVWGQTVKEVLQESGVKLNPGDFINPNPESLCADNQLIIVKRIKEKEITETKAIEFEKIVRKDKKLPWRTEKIKQKGKEGVKELKYLVTYEDGKEINRKLLSSKVVKEPVPEIKVVGTKIKVGRVQKGLASWYAYTGKMAAASTTFPKGTWLRVTAKDSGRQIIVQVNDYGPDPRTGKVLDLDKEAFKKLAPLGRGVIKVKIEEIKN